MTRPNFDMLQPEELPMRVRVLLFFAAPLRDTI